MKNFNTNIILNKSSSIPKDHSDNGVAQTVFRQELITWSHTENGIKKTTLVRNFSKERHTDSFFSEPIIFERDMK